MKSHGLLLEVSLLKWIQGPVAMINFIAFFFFLEGSAFMQDLDNWTLAYILPRVSITLLVVTFIYQETFHAAEVESKHCKKNEFFNLHCFRKEATQLCCHKWFSRDQGKYSDSTLHI